MNSGEKHDNNQSKISPYSYEQFNDYPNKKVKIIYDRYRKGKSITIDDLKYLWLNDFEGCNKLVKNFIELKKSGALTMESNDINSSIAMNKEEDTKEQQNSIDVISDIDHTIDTLKNITEIMESIKSMRENMSESEQRDISMNLFETLELEKLVKKMKDWDDTIIEKMMMYTYEDEKEFNVVV